MLVLPQHACKHARHPAVFTYVCLVVNTLRARGSISLISNFIVHAEVQISLLDDFPSERYDDAM